MNAPIDLSKSVRVHIVGVGGAGMSAIASVLAAMGHHVTGSDLKASPALARLGASGVRVQVGHDGALMDDAELVSISTAIPMSNHEVELARSRGIRVVSRAETLAAISRQRKLVAVSGTHGKTTTTTLLSLVLMEAGLHPSFLIGGDVNEIGTNAVWDSGDWLVVEADESDKTFLALDPAISVVTSVEPDHLDFYGGFEKVVEAFDQFCAKASEAVVTSADDPIAAEVGRRYGATLVGFSPDADVQIENHAAGRGGVAFDLVRRGQRMGRLSLPVTGAKLAQNAAVAAVTAFVTGVGFDAAERAFARFAGVARRFEHRGESRGVRFVDDYAHLPTEVSAVLEAARSVNSDGRVVAVFQPHRYSRTAALWEQFTDSFVGADVVLITDVYPAGEQPVPGVTGKLIADAVSAAHPDSTVVYVSDRETLASEVASLLRPGDLFMTLGAGDLTSLSDELLDSPDW
ncbi:MAG: UDP-N-acetylmuramate--L-alanine ligase [Acidimicrobiales bacterium]